MRVGPSFHLSYCSNIHPGETWAAVRANLGEFLPPIRRALAPEAPFGIGLRLSAEAALTLDQPDELARFREFLRAGPYYVFTINGFPYGVFHGEPVKERVYLPDWRDPARLEYTNRLARILAALLPDDPGMTGSVSTLPGAFKPTVHTDDDVRTIARQLLRHAAVLRGLRERTGRTIALAVEPEPRCLLESVDEVIVFFEQHLFDDALIRDVGRSGDGPLTIDDVRRHLGVCYDACHMAVEFETPVDAVQRMRAAGIGIPKIQLSSALRLAFQSGDGAPAAALGPFAEDVYLHQVVERTSAGLTHYTDLPDALRVEAAAATGPQSGEPREWRVHFHVPIFLDRMKGFETTQDHLVALLALLRRDPVCPHLEVETYTWDVLPPAYRTEQITDAVTRELSWVRDRLVG
jgi:hypothetical protein